MKFTYSVFVTLAVASGIASAADAGVSVVKDAFDRAGIPKSLKLDFTPKGVLDVSFTGPPQQGSQTPPPPIPLDHAGAQLSDKNVSGPPAFCIRSTGKPFDIGSGPFTVLMIDIGPATPEKSGNPSLVLAGSDFKFKDDGNCLANNTPAVMEYEAPKPSEGSQPHQVVTLVYKQPSGFDEKSAITGREDFNLTKFVDDNGVKDLVSGTFLSVTST